MLRDTNGNGATQAINYVAVGRECWAVGEDEMCVYVACNSTRGCDQTLVQ